MKKKQRKKTNSNDKLKDQSKPIYDTVNNMILQFRNKQIIDNANTGQEQIPSSTSDSDRTTSASDDADGKGEQATLEDVQQFLYQTDKLGMIMLSRGRLQYRNDTTKDNIDKLWGLCQYETDVDTSMLKADQKASLKRMKRKWSLVVSKKGKLMYDIVPNDKPATSNAQTSDGANNNETPTKSATIIMTTADSAKKMKHWAIHRQKQPNETKLMRSQH